MIENKLATLFDKSQKFIHQHSVNSPLSLDDNSLLSGEFSLYRDSNDFDLYGMVDTAYILYTLGLLEGRTDRASRQSWAGKILSCQEEDGWFTKRNLRGHSREHATAYAIGALRLLEVEADEKYLGQIRPLQGIKPILKDRATFLKWISNLDFRLNPGAILEKKLGWHYIWRGSHVGGGIPAAIGMTQALFGQWWDGEIDPAEWFDWYFEWLDDHSNADTGYWQRAIWNLFYRKPTLIDMAGAVHFFWIYAAHARPFPYPERVIESTLSVQKPDGLFKDHPFCIDLDGVFCIARSYIQLPKEIRPKYQDRVYRAVESNFQAIIRTLTENPLESIYTDSHGLPGALAALIECAKLPGFKYLDTLSNWQNPLDKVCWL